MTTPKDSRIGHRSRLRQRFLEGGEEALADYELLEMILFAAAPRSDTKPLAKDLLKKFKTMHGVLHAKQHELAAIKGMGDAAIASILAVRTASLKMLSFEAKKQPILRNWEAVVDYCRARLGNESVEEFRLLFLNNKNAMFHEEAQQRGTINQTAIYPREVVKRALELHAHAIIMVHNHPSGDTQPSKSDIEMTRAVASALKTVGISLHDHIVVSKSGYTSLKALGYI